VTLHSPLRVVRFGFLTSTFKMHGTLELFDLRASLAPVASIHAGKGGLAGMVLEPCGKPGTIVTGE
jgi:hypothetical protein